MNQARLELLVKPQQARIAERVANRIIAGVLSLMLIGAAGAAAAVKTAIDRFESDRAANDTRGTAERLWTLAVTTPPQASTQGTTFGDNAAYTRCTVFYGSDRGGGDRIWIADHCRRKHLDR